MSDKVYRFPIFKRGFGVRAVSAESNISQLKISGVWQFCGTWHLRHIWQFFDFSKDQKVTPRVMSHLGQWGATATREHTS